jgi:hypothetical protein
MLEQASKNNNLEPHLHELPESGIAPAVRGPLELFSSAIPLDLLSKIPVDLGGSNMTTVKETTLKNNAGLCGKLGLRAVFDPSAGALLVILGISSQENARADQHCRSSDRRTWARILLEIVDLIEGI